MLIVVFHKTSHYRTWQAWSIHYSANEPLSPSAPISLPTGPGTKESSSKRIWSLEGCLDLTSSCSIISGSTPRSSCLVATQLSIQWENWGSGVAKIYDEKILFFVNSNQTPYHQKVLQVKLLPKTQFLHCSDLFPLFLLPVGHALILLLAVHFRKPRKSEHFQLGNPLWEKQL